MRYSLCVTFDAIYDRLARLERYGGTRWGPDALFHAGLETRKSGDRYFWDGLKRGTPGHRPLCRLPGNARRRGRLRRRMGRNRADAGDGIPGDRAVGAPVLPTRAGRRALDVLLGGDPASICRRASGRATRGVCRKLSGSPGESFACPRLGVVRRRISRPVRRRAGPVLALDGSTSATSRESSMEVRAATPLEEGRPCVRAAPSPPTRRCIGSRSTARDESEPVLPPFQIADGRLACKILAGNSPRRSPPDGCAHTDETLTTVADATGFADANHLCKAFKRRFHTSPGAFRRQLR